MLMGAFFGIFGADLLDSWFLGLLVGMAAGGLLALVHAVFSINLRADQVVSGIAINFLAARPDRATSSSTTMATRARPTTSRGARRVRCPASRTSGSWATRSATRAS